MFINHGQAIKHYLLACNSVMTVYPEDNIVRKTINVLPHSLLTHCLKCLEMISFFEDYILRVIFFQTRDCSIIRSCVGGGGGVSVFSEMENNCVTENKGEWYFMKGHNVTVKIIIKPFFVLL